MPRVIGLLALLFVVGCGGVEPIHPNQTANVADVSGKCPSKWTVGDPIPLDFTVAHPGGSEWSTTHLSLAVGADKFVVDDVMLDDQRVEPSVWVSMAPTYRGESLAAGESVRVRMTLTPIEPGNVTFQFLVWDGDSKVLPFDDAASCPNIAITP